MSRNLPDSDLDKYRLRIVDKVRELRTARRWTQAELAGKLGLSQARLSEIERGGGSLTAEQLIAVLQLFNVSIDEFLPPQDPEDELQNALARLGAFHLREVPNVVPSERAGGLRAVARETLVAPRSSRLVLALAPAVVANLDALNLDTLHDDLAALGFPARVPWFVATLREALFKVRVAKGRSAASAWHRAVAYLGDFVARHPPPATAPGQWPPVLDYLDAAARSPQTLAAVKAAASEVSRQWGVVTEVQPSDFAEALGAARASV